MYVIPYNFPGLSTQTGYSHRYITHHSYANQLPASQKKDSISTENRAHDHKKHSKNLENTAKHDEPPKQAQAGPSYSTSSPQHS